MTIPLPMPLAGPISRWQVNDWIVRSGSTGPAAGGKATLELPVGPDELWLVDHATVSCTAATPTRVRWYEASVSGANLADGSDTGNFDVGEWASGLLFRPSTSLIVVWTGLTSDAGLPDGAVGSVRLQARQLIRQAS